VVEALAAAGVDEENMFIEKVSGKLAFRPKLDTMLERLVAGDEVVVTRLKRIGRSQQHLLELVRWFGAHDVDFVVLEQGIDASTPGGRLVFHFLAALAEYDREMIVEGTMDGLAGPRPGRWPALGAVAAAAGRFPLAADRWPRLKAIVYVVDGVVARIRAVEADLSRWDTDDRGYADVPVTKPLTELQIAKKLPTLTIALGEARPHVRGKIREYVSL
jgi:hypothetical protein